MVQESKSIKSWGKLLALMFASLLIVAACSSSSEEAADDTGSTEDAGQTAAAAVYTPLSEPPCDLSEKKIHYLSVLKGHPTLRLWQQGFYDQANALGFGEVTIASPDEADWTKAVALGEGILATGTDGLVLGFVDPSEKDLIKRFGDAGIPAVIGHVQVQEGEYPGVIAYAAFNPAEWGAAAAEVIGEKMGGSGTAAITQGGFNPVEDGVAAAFTQRMNELYPDIKVLPAVEEGFDLPSSISKIVALLTANPDVTGAISTTGAGPVAWAGAVDETGRQVNMIGPDMTRPNMDAVRDGKILGLAAQPGYEEHQMAVDIVANAICGNPPAQFANDLPSPIILADGLAPYYAVVDAIDARVASEE